MSACRAAAADAFAALASRVTGKQVVGAAAVSLLDVLDGKAVGGKPKAAPERSGMLAGVQALAAAPGSSASMQQTAGAVVLRLLSVYKAEANDEVSVCYGPRGCRQSNHSFRCAHMRPLPSCFSYNGLVVLQVKLSLVAALGAWLQRMQQLPEAVLAHFQSGLKEKEVLRRAHLRCLAQVGQFCREERPILTAS